MQGSVYSPGPGFYNNKYKSSFVKEYMKSEQDQDSYYLIQNGTLLRKTQAMAANRGIARMPDVNARNMVPGPGAYSPRNNLAQTADKANKPSSLFSGSPLETIKSNSMLDDTYNFGRKRSGVELH